MDNLILDVADPVFPACVSGRVSMFLRRVST